VIYLCIL